MISSQSTNVGVSIGHGVFLIQEGNSLSSNQHMPSSQASLAGLFVIFLIRVRKIIVL